MSDFVTPWTRLLYPWNSPGILLGLSSHSLLQGIFPTQGLNPGLPHCRQILYQLSHKGSPGMLEWVAYPFSSGSSQPRNWTGVSCIVGGFFTNWAIREAQEVGLPSDKGNVLLNLCFDQRWARSCPWAHWEVADAILFKYHDTLTFYIEHFPSYC